MTHNCEQIPRSPNSQGFWILDTLWGPNSAKVFDTLWGPNSARGWTDPVDEIRQRLSTIQRHLQKRQIKEVLKQVLEMLKTQVLQQVLGMVKTDVLEQVFEMVWKRSHCYVELCSERMVCEPQTVNHIIPWSRGPIPTSEEGMKYLPWGKFRNRG